MIGSLSHPHSCEDETRKKDYCVIKKVADTFSYELTMCFSFNNKSRFDRLGLVRVFPLLLKFC